MNMEDIIKESQSHLKRATALIDYFSRAFAKDICMKISIVFIALVVIGIIVMTVFAKGSTSDKKAVEVKAAEAATNTNRWIVDCQTQAKSGNATLKKIQDQRVCQELTSSLDKKDDYEIELPPGYKLSDFQENNLEADATA